MVPFQRPWFGDLLGRLSSTMDGASRALKDAPQRFLDALVDATFRFTDQALNSAEVGSLGGNETKPSMAFPPSCMLTVSIGLCLQSNFAPVDETGEAIEIHQSQIQGAIPDGFPEGVYIRNGDGFSHFPLLALSVSMSERERESERPVNIVLGSNPLFGALHSTSSVLGQSREIWVEGEGMLHAVYFTKSSAGHLWSVSYASRYVQSETLELETARHKPCFLPAVEGDSAAIVAAYVFNYVSKNFADRYHYMHGLRTTIYQRF